MATDWRTALGSDNPPDGSERLTVGAFTLDLQGSDAIAIRLAGREVVRRLGVRVRDREWESVPSAVAGAVSADGDRHGARRFDVHHRGGASVDFSWVGRIEADGDALVYEMDGRAGTAMEYNRIGLVVLHPPEVTVGRAFRADAEAGSLEGELPTLVGPQRRIAGAPQPLFPAFSRVQVEIDPDCALVFEFEGDLFEMEDQRNWSDGSFKTYSTPVALPVPRRLAAGDRLVQRVRIEPIGSWPTRNRTGTAAHRLTIRADTGGAIPAIGVGLDTDGYEPTPPEIAALRDLGLAHLRVDVEAGATAAADLQRGDRVAEALGTDIELAMTLSGSTAEALASLAELEDELRACWPRVTRVLVFHRSEAATAPGWIELMKSASPDPDTVSWATGTRAHFAEINCAPPDMQGVGGLAFPMTPQVHDADEFSLATSLEAQGHIVATARAIADGRAIHVTPVTLKPRFNAYASDGVGALTDADGVPTNIDTRQVSTFLAAWAIGSGRRLSDSGASSVTYFELTGARGVMERESGTPWPDRMLSTPGQRFPVFWVVSHLAHGLRRGLVDTHVPAPFTAIGYRSDRGVELLIGNLAPHSVSLDISDAGEIVQCERLVPGEPVAASPKGGRMLEFEPYDAIRLRCLP